MTSDLNVAVALSPPHLHTHSHSAMHTHTKPKMWFPPLCILLAFLSVRKAPQEMALYRNVCWRHMYCNTIATTETYITKCTQTYLPNTKYLLVFLIVFAWGKALLCVTLHSECVTECSVFALCNVLPLQFKATESK